MTYIKVTACNVNSAAVLHHLQQAIKYLVGDMTRRVSWGARGLIFKLNGPNTGYIQEAHRIGSIHINVHEMPLTFLIEPRHSDLLTLYGLKSVSVTLHSA